jgi:hypothetical protein
MNRFEIETKRLETRKKLIESNFQIKQVTNQLVVIEMERLRQKKERENMHKE